MKHKTILETANVNNTTFKMHVTSCPNKMSFQTYQKTKNKTKKKTILNKHIYLYKYIELGLV